MNDGGGDYDDDRMMTVTMNWAGCAYVCVCVGGNITEYTDVWRWVADSAGHTLCGQNVEILIVKSVVYIVTTGL